MNLEPIRALITLAAEIDVLWAEVELADNDSYDAAVDKWTKAKERFAESAFRRVPDLSQLLEAVTNLEKLEAELRIEDPELLPEANDARIESWVNPWTGVTITESRQPTPEAAEPFGYVYHFPQGISHQFSLNRRSELLGWVEVPVFAHPPKPEPTEAVAERIKKLRGSIQLAATMALSLWGELDDEEGNADAAAVSEIHTHLLGTLIGDDEDAQRAPAAPKPPAEWMAEAGEAILHALMADQCLIAGIKPTAKYFTGIIAKHAPKVPEGWMAELQSIEDNHCSCLGEYRCDSHGVIQEVRDAFAKHYSAPAGTRVFVSQVTGARQTAHRTEGES